MNTETTILIGVSVYLLAMIAIGIAVSKRSGTQDDFIVAGRKLPLWLCVPTIIATWFGAGTMLGAAATGYEGGFLASIATPFGTSLTLILVGFFFVRTLRRMKLLTVADFFENRFGHVSAMVAAVALVLYRASYPARKTNIGSHLLMGLSAVGMLKLGYIILFASVARLERYVPEAEVEDHRCRDPREG